MASPTSFERAYEDSGRGAIDSSTGTMSGGLSGLQGSPRTSSLDAQTTFRSRCISAAANTLYVETVLILKVSADGRSRGPDTAAR